MKQCEGSDHTEYHSYIKNMDMILRTVGGHWTLLNRITLELQEHVIGSRVEIYRESVVKVTCRDKERQHIANYMDRNMKEFSLYCAPFIILCTFEKVHKFLKSEQ